MKPTQETCARHVREISAFLACINDEAKEAGLTWYTREHRTAQRTARRSGYPTRAICACLAVLSPRCQWNRAKHALEVILAGGRPTGIFPRNIEKAEAILATRNGIPIDPTTAPKTWAFWHNLWRPSDPEFVTLDSWMFRAHNMPLTPGLRSYRVLADAYRAVARDRGFSPNQLQAIIWLHVKEESKHG
jgi:hypothetical protein